MRILPALISLVPFFAPDNRASAGRPFSQSLLLKVPSVPGWLSSTSASILKARGGSNEALVTADPEGVTLQGVIPSAESLYLPGLLDTSIHRTNKVRPLHIPPDFKNWIFS